MIPKQHVVDYSNVLTSNKNSSNPSSERSTEQYDKCCSHKVYCDKRSHGYDSPRRFRYIEPLD